MNIIGFLFGFNLFFGRKTRIGGITKVLEVNDEECCKRSLITKKALFY